MALRPHKVTATILFTDLISSTEFVQRAGDDRAGRVISAHIRILVEAAELNGGRLVKTAGDGGLFVFSSATDGLAAAMEMQEAGRHPVAGQPLQLQAGLNTGDVIVEGDDYFGLHVVIAERLCKLAEPGQVVCSGSVAGLLPGQSDFVFQDLGALQLKGVATPVQAYEVVPQRRTTAERLTRMPFVGRSAEVQRLERRLDRALRGHGSVALVTGEPGIGKTRVAEEVGAFAQDAGAIVGWARCYPGEGFGRTPVASLVEALIAGNGSSAPASQLAGEDLNELAWSVPGLAFRPEPMETADVSPGAALAAATCRFFQELTSKRPAVAVFDDVQWASPETAAVLRSLARIAPRHRLLVVATCRDGEVDPSLPIADVLAALPKESDLEVVQLKGLGVEDVTAFVRIASDSDDEALGQALARHTGGNPYFVREVLLSLSSGEDAERGWRDAVEKLSVTPGMQQVTVRRIERLPPATRQFLTTAAAFESQFSFGLVARAAALDEALALSAVDESLRAQLIRPAEAVDAYEFTHWIIGQALRDSLSPSRLARLHRDVAATLQASSAGVRAVAFHLRAAGTAAEPLEVARICLMAGEEALMGLSYDEAIANFKAAEAAAPANGDPVFSADALHGLARAQAELGHVAEALLNFKLAHDLYRRSDQSARLAEGLYYRARLHLFRLEWDDTQTCLSEAREVLLSASNIDERERKRILARVLEQTAQLIVRSGRFGDADQLESEAIELAEELGNPNLLAETIFARGWTRLQRLQVTEAIDDLSRYREIASANRYPLQDLVGAIRGGFALMLAGELSRARDWALPAQERAAAAGRSRDETYACIPLAGGALLQGDLAEAERHVVRGLAIGNLDDPFVTNGLIPVRAYAASLRGDNGLALKLIDPLLTRDEREGRPRSSLSGFGYQALLRALAGDLAAARAMATAIAERLRPRPPDLRYIPTYAIMAELALVLRQRQIADLLFETIAAVPAHGLKVAPSWPVLASRLIGGLAGLRGDSVLARLHLDEALHFARVCGSQLEEALVEFELARLDDGQSSLHLERGERIAAELRLPGLSARANAVSSA